MKIKNKSFGIRVATNFIFAVCGIFLIVSSTQAITKKALLLAPREVRVVTQNAAQGQTVTVVIEADAMGDESVYGFTLNYNTAVLTYIPNSVAIGSGATRQAGGSCDLLENADTAGRIGFSIDCNASTITAGNARQLATMRFTVASNAALGSTPLTFGDTPARRAVASSPRAGAVTNLPTTFTNGNVNITVSSGQTRIVRASTQNSTRGATITYVIETDAVGDESVYGFTLNYNTAVLTYIPNSVAIGSGATRQAGGSCDLLENADTAGRIGFSIDCNASTITAGNARQLATMRFTVASNAALGSTPLTFGDTPARRAVASSPRAGAVTNLPTTFSDGAVRINAASTTAALVEISGKVSLPRGTAISNAIVQINKGNETLTTRTNAFGRYSFKVSAGETYVISVSHKRYQFASRAVSISETTGNLDFTAER